MTKTQLRLLAIVLSGLILVVLFAGLDDLPRKVRAEIASEQQNYAAAQKNFQKIRDEVSADLRAEPELFRVRDLYAALPARLSRVEGNLQTAGRDIETLARYAKANRRTDRERVEQLLRDERKLRSTAVTEAGAVGVEAREWIERKNHLPEQVAQMKQDHESLRSVDLLKLAAAVQKAESDWPDKAGDLETRLAAVSREPAQAENIWLSSADLRRRVEANELAGLDYPSLIGYADELHRDATEFPEKTKELQGLAGQLYDSWDKLLVDLDVRKGGEPRYEEKIRIVRTHYPDATAKKGDVTTDESWVDVSKAQYDSVAKDLGMAIEHKPVGKYDSEAERVAQPAGFAYVAPPAQGSNQYGYWDHRGGQSFWIWFPQYLILRDALSNRYYPPLTSYEYEEYRVARSRGWTYYGRDDSVGSTRPKYGSNGTYTERRYSDNTFSRNGGYRDSRYANQPGSYRGSRYQSPASRSGGNSEPRTFGRGSSGGNSRPSWSGHSSGGGSRSAPRGGRTFGGGGRRR